MVCGSEVNTPLGGRIPIVGKALLSYKDLLLTSVVSTAPHSYTVAFLATDTGVFFLLMSARVWIHSYQPISF